VAEEKDELLKGREVEQIKRESGRERKWKRGLERWRGTGEEEESD
jgi:hypothetical protein